MLTRANRDNGLYAVRSSITVTAELLVLFWFIFSLFFVCFGQLTGLMYRYLHGTAPLYLMNSCTLSIDLAGRQHCGLPVGGSDSSVLSSQQFWLSVFCYCRCVESTWNSLPHSLYDSALSHNIFGVWRRLKAYFIYEILTRCTVLSAVDHLRMRYANWHYT